MEQVVLPQPHAVPHASAAADAAPADFWVVDDIFAFENMGFSHSVDGRKYLACAECEFGPIGFHDLQSTKSYLSVARVVTAS